MKLQVQCEKLSGLLDENSKVKTRIEATTSVAYEKINNQLNQDNEELKKENQSIKTQLHALENKMLNKEDQVQNL